MLDMVEKISWAGPVKSEVLHSVKETRKVLHAKKGRKAGRIGDILRRNCPMKHVIEGKREGRIEVKRRRGRRCKQLLVDFKEKKGNCRLKEKALDRALWRTGLRRGCGPVVRQAGEWMNQRELCVRCEKYLSFKMPNILKLGGSYTYH